MKNRLFVLFVLVFLALPYVYGGGKKTSIRRTETPPRIDGIAEEVWNSTTATTDFVQHDPWMGAAPSQATEVRLLYDDKAIYVFARMYDLAPDSILLQLGNRDESPNADWFTIKFDTYNNQLDAYIFTVFASGVQADYRYSDDSYNAVWESKTHVDEQGWTAEMRIPYSALRFPVKPVQDWRLQMERNLRRKREDIIWAPEVKEADNRLKYWGELSGLENIQPPLRLSFTPYLSGGVDHYPNEDPALRDFNSFYSGGMDLKFGINESYTLDMTLLPDFSQVQSDDKVKNLSAFETVYSEQRPFFLEAVDLFSKGGLFYSRRIGRTPRGFYRAQSMAASDETVIRNPTSSSLVNAFKVSGRSKNGLALGLLNAFTADTWATLESENGSRRRVLTEPAADYAILVMDQALKNNSSVYVANSSFLRNSPNYSSNVTAAGINLIDASNTWRLSASGGYAGFYNTSPDDTRENGIKSALNLSKINGKIQYGLSQDFYDDHFNANDAGLTLYNNYLSHSAWLSYIQNVPRGYFKNYKLTLSFNNNYNYQPFDMTENSLSLSGFTTLMNYLWLWGGADVQLTPEKDYYEPRLPGRYYLKEPSSGIYLNFSSDYRKTLALDGGIAYYAAKENRSYASFEMKPIVRVSNHFLFSHELELEYSKNDAGFVTFASDGGVIFGRRDVETGSQTFSGTYVFVNDLSLSMRARHYWSNGKYFAYPLLMPDGTLDGDYGETVNGDFNYTSFNIDMVFSWQFSPGSILNLIWKYELLHEGDAKPGSYFGHMNEAFIPPARNMLSVKFLYYLDYLMFRRK